jgi:hypothetical protein
MQMINDGMVKGDKGDPFEYEDFTEEQLADLKDGLNTTVAYGNYQTMITAFNSLPKTAYTVGQNVMIVTLNVPDLWIASIEETAVKYEYVSDEAFVESLKNSGTVKVGNYVFAALETQKVDLADHVKFTDLATQLKAGVVYKAAQGEIIRRAFNYYIDAYYLPFGVKNSLTNVAERDAWTDDDKAKACETIGAVGKNEITYDAENESLTIGGNE